MDKASRPTPSAGNAVTEAEVEWLRIFAKAQRVLYDNEHGADRLEAIADRLSAARPLGDDAIQDALEIAATVIDRHRPDASFDDSGNGTMERNALLDNIAAEIRAALPVSCPLGDDATVERVAQIVSDEAREKLCSLRRLCEASGQPFYVEILDEVIPVLARERDKVFAALSVMGKNDD